MCDTTTNGGTREEEGEGDAGVVAVQQPEELSSTLPAAATSEMRGSSDDSTDSSDDADDDDGGTQDNRFAPNAIARRVSDSAALRCDDLPDDYRSTEYQGARRRHSDADLPSLNPRPSARVYVNSDDECDDEEGSDCDDDDAQQGGVVGMLLGATLRLSSAVETGVRWTWKGLTAPSNSSTGGTSCGPSETGKRDA
jgi:hypothetical protein